MLPCIMHVPTFATLGRHAAIQSQKGPNVSSAAATIAAGSRISFNNTSGTRQSQSLLQLKPRTFICDGPCSGGVRLSRCIPKELPQAMAMAAGALSEMRDAREDLVTCNALALDISNTFSPTDENATLTKGSKVLCLKALGSAFGSSGQDG